MQVQFCQIVTMPSIDVISHPDKKQSPNTGSPHKTIESFCRLLTSSQVVIELPQSELPMNKKILEKQKETQERRRLALMQQGQNSFTFASIKGGGMTPTALSPFAFKFIQHVGIKAFLIMTHNNINRNHFNFVTKFQWIIIN